jgi:hypothetical protein
VDNVIEVRYAGVVVGRSTRVRDWSAAGAFIGFAEPLPSGTPLLLRADGVEQPARVVEVIESADPAVAGMQVRFVSASEIPSLRAPAQPVAKPAAAPAAEEVRPEAAAVPPAAADDTASATHAETGEAEAGHGEAEAAHGEAEAAHGEAGNPGDAGQGGQGGAGGKRRRRRR